MRRMGDGFDELGIQPPSQIIGAFAEQSLDGSLGLAWDSKPSLQVSLRTTQAGALQVFEM